MRVELQNNSPSLYFLARFQFFLLIEISAQRWGAFQVDIKSTKGTCIPMNMIMKIQLGLFPRFASGLFRSKIRVLISQCDPPLGCELWSHLWHKVSRIWILHSHAENPQSMRWNVSRHQAVSLSLRCQYSGRGSVHSCSVDPGSSLVSVCQRSTFVPLFFRQSIQCCRVSPCEWQPKDIPPGQCRDRNRNLIAYLIS